MKVKSRLDFDKVAFNKVNNVNVVLTITAPPIDWKSKRAPVCIVPVIDVSGSMSGDKIDFAKKSVMKLIEHLQPGDFCGVVTFASQVETVAKPAEMTQARKTDLIAKVGALHSRDWTNFSGGMTTALEQVNALDLPPGVVTRVIMFTDGQANKGIAIGPDEIVTLAKKVRGKASISAFGYGADANQDLLSTLATACDGNYAFVRNPEDALTAFAKELGGLLSTYAQDIRVELTPHNGHKISEVLSDVDVEQKDQVVTIRFPEILGEEERSLVVAMTLSEQTKALPRPVNIAKVKTTYELLDDTGKRTSKTLDTTIRIEFVKAGDEQVKPTEDVDKIVGMAQLVKKQIEAEKAADRGDYAAAAATMDFAIGNFAARGLGGHVAAAKDMRAKLDSAASYGLSSGYRNSLKKAVTRGTGVSSGKDEEYFLSLSGMGYDVGGASNSVQDELMAGFTAGKDAGPAPLLTGAAGGLTGVAIVHTAAPGSVVIPGDSAGALGLSNLPPAAKPEPEAKPVTKKPDSVAKKRSDRW